MIEAYLKSFGILTDADIAMLEGKTYERFIAKGEFFVKEGQIAKEAGFVKSGHLRSHYYASNGEDVTYCFVLPQTIATAYSSFIMNAPSQENIQALSDTELTCISRDSILELEEESVNWLKLSKFIAQHEYLSMEKRVFLLQKESAENRYMTLLENEPELLQLVSQEQLASYLGITKRHLTRIRGAVLG